MRLSPSLSVPVIIVFQVMGLLFWMAFISMVTYRVNSADAGMFLYLFSIAVALEAASDLGLRFTVVTRLSALRSSNRRSNLIWNSILTKVVLSTVVILLIGFLFLAGLFRYTAWPQVALVGVVCVTLPSSNPIVWMLRARQMQWFENGCLVVYRALILLVLFVLPASVLSVNSLLFTVLAGNIVFLVIGSLPVLGWLKEVRRNFSTVKGSTSKELLRQSYSLGLSLFASQLAARYWVLVLGFFLMTGQILAFATSQMLVQSSLLLGVALGSAYLPVLSRLHETDKSRFQNLGKSLVVAAYGVGVAVALFLSITAGPLMRILFNQPRSDSAELLILLAGVCPFILVSFVCRFIMSAAEIGRSDLIAVLSGFVPVAAAALVIAPKYSSIGLAALYLIGELVTMSSKLFFLRSTLRFSKVEWVLPLLMTIPAYLIISMMFNGGQMLGSYSVLAIVSVGTGTATAFLVLYVLINRDQILSLLQPFSVDR